MDRITHARLFCPPLHSPPTATADPRRRPLATNRRATSLERVDQVGDHAPAVAVDELTSYLEPVVKRRPNPSRGADVAIGEWKTRTEPEKRLNAPVLNNRRAAPVKAADKQR